jgi:hypothetical protein
MSRRFVAGLSLALILTAASSAEAQVGGLIKKAKEKAAAGAGVQTSADQPANHAGPTITTETVDRFLTGLKAEKAAMDRAAANQERRKKAREERDKQEALAGMDPEARKALCVSEKMNADPKHASLEKASKEMNAAAERGDNAKVMELSMQVAPLQAEIQQRAEATCTAELKKTGGRAAPPTAEQEAILNAPDVPPEEAGAKAANMPMVDYAQVKEYIQMYVNYGTRTGLTDAEKKAIEAKKKELKEGLKAIGMG